MSGMLNAVGPGSLFGNSPNAAGSALNSAGAAANLGVVPPPNYYGSSGATGVNPNWSGMPQQAIERRDPFEYACEVAAMQPSDKRWRRFQNALFLLDHVIGVHAEGSGTIILRLHANDRAGGTMSDYNYAFTLPFDCQCPVQWFAEHVMGMEFPNTKHAV